MKDLYRCLAEYSPAMFQAIADAWHISLSREQSLLAQVDQMAAAMLAQEPQTRLLATLSEPARSALHEIVTQGGLLPGHRLTLRYGAIRRFGPARLERERPWTDPANAIEELYYKGLVYRVYGTIGSYYGEILLVPEPLKSSLPAPAAEQLCSLATVAEPARKLAQGSALAEDIFALLVRIRQSQIPGPLPGSEPLKIDDTGLELLLAQRWQGAMAPARRALLWRLVTRLRLVKEDQGWLAPTLRARAWLKLTDQQRLAGLFTAWRDDTQWNELRRQPTLQFEETGWKNDPALARHNLLRFLANCPRGVWMHRDEWLAALKSRHPDFMRPDGDFESWFIRDAETGTYLTGFEAWDQVEGLVARAILEQELYWLGLVELGASAGSQELDLFRLNEASALLAADNSSSVAPEHAGTPSAAQIDDDLQICLPIQDTMYERYQLERLAEWQSQAELACYKITAESIWASQNTGIKIDQILGFLMRITHNQVPDALKRALQAWGERFGRVFIRRVLVLQTVDQETMRQLRERPDLAAMLGEALSATACLVHEQDVDTLTARLKSLGIWPHIKL